MATFSLQPDADINATLALFEQYCRAPQEGTPMLVLRGTGESKHLEVIRNKRDTTQISCFARVCAYFGFGNASMNNVCSFLVHHSAEINVQDENIERALIILNRKIQRRNAHSVFAHVEIPIPIPLTSPVILPAGSYGGGIDTTAPLVEREETEDYSKLPKCLDFVQILPERGLLVLADGTGHATYSKAKQKHYDVCNEALVNAIQASDTNTPITDLKNKYRGLLAEVNSIFGREGYQSTLIIAQIIRDSNSNVHLFYVSAGDSDLYIIHADGSYKRLTDPSIHGRNDFYTGFNTALGGNIRRALYASEILQSGDRIIAVSDGVTDFMGEAYLIGVIQEADTTPENLLSKLRERILTVNQSELQGKKVCNPAGDSHCFDDLAAGMIIYQIESGND